MISHVAFITEKMDLTIDFYQALFNFSKAFTLYQEDGTPWIEYLIDANGAFIELFYRETPSQSNQGNSGGTSFFHFCIEVDDILEIIKRAENLGISVFKPLKLGLDQSLQCWFIDPNGIQVEVMQMTESSLQTKVRNKTIP